MNTLTHSDILELDKKYGTPFYIMYPELFCFNIKSFINAFKKRYNRIIVGYSFKTNYVPTLCKHAKKIGCYAEVVSELEFKLAEKLGFNNIIFNGPIKRETVIHHAIESGAIINLDSEYEVDTICKYRQAHPNSTIKVGLRINVMLQDSNGNSTIQCGLKTGRFGFPFDILEYNIKRLRDNQIIINSIHGHTSSFDRTSDNYKIISQEMLKVCELFNLEDINYFDVGGGFFGAAAEGFNVKGKPSYEDYANTILETVLSNDWFIKHSPYIVIEPGASVVSNAFNYVTKVFQTKVINNTNFASVDGSVFDVKPTMHSFNAPYEVIQHNNSSETLQYDIVGSTCMEKDIILKNVSMPLLQNGDYILIKGLGAYTISLTPTFINYLPPILSITDGVITEVRRRQTIEDIISLYK